jgi:predicted Zn finger-like uncharacterized protein
LFTVCPKCTLTLVVTTVDLRAGQGYVRCGRCANVFNALVALREGEPNTGAADSATRRLSETAPDPAVQPAMGVGVAIEPEPEPEPEPDVEIEFPSELQTEGYELTFEALEPELEAELLPEAEPDEGSLEFNATATDVSEIFISPSEAEHDTGSGNYEAVVLGVETQPPPLEPVERTYTDTIAAEDWSLLDDDAPPADAESVIEESPLVEPDQEAPTQDPEWVQEMFAEAEAEAQRGRSGERQALPLAVEQAGEDEPAVVRAARDVMGVSAPSGDTVLEPLLGPPVQRRPAWQYLTAIGLLTLALLLQVVHHYRHALVLSPSLGPTVSAVYARLGATLTPRWDLTAYSVTQRGVDAEDSEGTRLRVRLSVQNDSDRVQPLPLVRLTLKDRYNNAVATRDLTPAEYLPPRAAQQRLLEPDQRIDAELHVMDPGRAAVGFEIDACLRAEDGSVGCSNEARLKSAG